MDLTYLKDFIITRDESDQLIIEEKLKFGASIFLGFFAFFNLNILISFISAIHNLFFASSPGIVGAEEFYEEFKLIFIAISSLWLVLSFTFIAHLIRKRVITVDKNTSSVIEKITIPVFYFLNRTKITSIFSIKHIEISPYYMRKRNRLGYNDLICLYNLSLVCDNGNIINIGKLDSKQYSEDIAKKIGALIEKPIKDKSSNE